MPVRVCLRWRGLPSLASLGRWPVLTIRERVRGRPGALVAGRSESFLWLWFGRRPRWGVDGFASGAADSAPSLGMVRISPTFRKWVLGKNRDLLMKYYVHVWWSKVVHEVSDDEIGLTIIIQTR